jgi:RNA polymerase sigma-70 factor (ECF subfamily)
MILMRSRGLRLSMHAVETSLVTRAELEDCFEEHRPALTGFCYRILGSPFDAEDAVQEAFIRAWRGVERFEGRSALRSWLYRIATNVCLDMASGRERRARPMDLGPAGAPVIENLHTRAEATWIEPMPDPAEAVLSRETVRLAFVAALQRLPPRQRAALVLCEVLHWQAGEAAELLETTVASVNSALQRARATLASLEAGGEAGGVDEELLARYVAAFEAYDIERLTAIIHEDAVQSMPPYDLWLTGRDDIFSWWLGPGIACRGARVLPAGRANGCAAFAQYKPAPGGGHEPWALQVIETSGGRVSELTFVLDTDRLFPLFGVPARLEA